VRRAKRRCVVLWDTLSAVLNIGIVLGGLLFYGLVARILARWWLSPALVLMGLAFVLSSAVLNFADVTATETVISEVAIAALATVLFTEASLTDIRIAREVAAIPTRLLGIGLPLTVAFGAVLAHFFFPAMSWALAFVLATILAPTDAALGRPVVTNPAVPVKLRSALSIESGLNDGLAVPILLLALAVETGDSTRPFWLTLKVIGIGVGIGLLGGGLLGILTNWLRQRDDFEPEWAGVIPALAAIVIYVAADHLEGSGFVAAFVGGIAYGISRRRRAPVTEAELIPSVDISVVLNGATWFLFGAIPLAYLVKSHPTWQVWLYAVLSLTVVRMIPVALSLIGTHAQLPTVAFTGWFGPRGLASVVFLIVFLDAGTQSAAAKPLVQTAGLTIVLSVIAHGLSATPLAAQYGRWAAKTPAHSILR